MSAKKDFYDILGVSKTASQEEIKKAFYKQAAKHHPDKGGDEKLFKEANEAYQTLSDKDKRAAYDRFGHAGPGGQGGASSGGPFGGFDFSGGFGTGGASFDMDDLEDMIGGMFGGFGGRSRASRGEDIQVTVTLSLADVLKDYSREISYMRNKSCGVCKGTGGQHDSPSETCSTCKGAGKTKSVKRTILGSFETVAECKTCHGNGKVYKRVCSHCHGTAIAKEKETVTITIPSGISDGEALRMAGYGEMVRSGQTGDLIIVVEIKADKYWRREGQTLVSTLHISLSESLLGVRKDIPGLDGPVTVVVGPLSRHGDTVKISGKGVPSLRSGVKRGDAVVVIHVDLPKKLSKEQESLVGDLLKHGM